MTKSLHEQASEILAEVLELPTNEAMVRIERLCGSNTELKENVLELYAEIVNDKEELPEQKYTDEKGTTKLSRINVEHGFLKTKIIGGWTKLLFGNKKKRLITIILLLLLLFGFAYTTRNQFRKEVLESEKEAKQAILNTQLELLQQWISNKMDMVSDVASDKDFVQAAYLLDSLVESVAGYDSFKNEKLVEPIFKIFKEKKEKYKLQSLSVINRREPVYMFLLEEYIDGTQKVFYNVQMGKAVYDYFLDLQKGNPTFIPPVHDIDRFAELDTTLSEGTYCTFCCPVYRNDKIIAFAFADYLAKNEFSSILRTAHHGKSSESYAFDIEGHMISSSRFTKDLQKTSLLNYDTTKTTIYHIELRDPGVDVTKGDEPKGSRIEQPYTKIFEQARNSVLSNDTVLQGAIINPYNDYRGIKVIGAWKWLPKYDFGLIAEEDAAEALATLKSFDKVFVIFFVIILILSFLLYNSNVRIVKFGNKIEDFGKLGQYLLKEKIGEGGFGQVYKAEHTFLKTPVAIKLLKKEFSESDILTRFEKEVKVTSSLAHPNTIRVFDYGTSENGQFYYVMEYLNGITLDRIVSNEKVFPVNRTIYILLHTCYSLQEAHKKGLVHRDIKPGNIMLCNQGGAYDVVKVLDFGLVKNVDAGMSQQTQMNRIGGTPMFMAPERIRDPFNADQRVDIYAVGALGLYVLSGQYIVELISQKMLSGQETLQSNFKERLIDRDDVPEELRKLLTASINFAPEKRPDSIGFLIDELEELNKKYPWSKTEAQNWWKKFDVYG